jgi:MFS family permease
VTGGALSAPYRAITLGIVVLVSLVAFEAMAVGSAMPVVAAELRAGGGYTLAFSLFMTTSLVGTVVGGTWCDARGARTPILAGLVLFAGGLVVCGLATSLVHLLAGRVVSGAGGGLLGVSLYVVIGDTFPDELRARVFGWVSAAWVLPSVLGPPVAGYLATQVTWRAVFLVVPPLVLVAAAVMVPRLSGLRRGHPAAADAGTAAGWRRAALGTALAVGAGALQWGAQRLDPPTAVSAAAVVVGLGLVAACLPRLVPAGTLRGRRGLPSVVAVRGLFAATFFAAETFVPLMLVEQRSLSPALAGLSLTGGALGWAAASYVQGRPGLRTPRHVLLAVGAALVALSVALLPLALLAPLPLLVVLPAWTLAGFGMGLGMSTTGVLVLRLSAVAEQGRNSSAMQVSDSLGAVLGLGAAGAVYATLHTPAGAADGTFAGIWLGLALLGVVAAAVGLRTRPPRTDGTGDRDRRLADAAPAGRPGSEGHHPGVAR